MPASIPPSKNRPLRVLILGGTGEAMELARLLADTPGIAPLYALAGRTAVPEPPPIPYRIGGFGGAAGLAEFLVSEKFDALVDATHPFAVQITRNAASACATLGLPWRTLSRPPWHSVPGDQWTSVPDLSAAARALGNVPRRVFLTTGRLRLAAFEGTPHHFLIRAIDPPVSAPAFAHTLLLARPPFTLEGERALMLAHGIDVLVTKNSGSGATAAKLLAARELGIAVVMVERPEAAAGVRLDRPTKVLEWLARLPILDV